MRRMILAAAIMLAATGGMVTLAAGAPGQCMVSGYGTFDCDVTLDGGGLTFALPAGETFAFTLTGEDVGTAFLIAADARPGQVPDDLGPFHAVADKAGCWAQDEGVEFCVLVEQ